MSKKILILHAVNHINQTIRLSIQIRLIYLLNIPREDHLSSLAGTRDNSLDFMRSQVLRLINNTISLTQAPSAEKAPRGTAIF